MIKDSQTQLRIVGECQLKCSPVRIHALPFPHSDHQFLGKLPIELLSQSLSTLYSTRTYKIWLVLPVLKIPLSSIDYMLI